MESWLASLRRRRPWLAVSVGIARDGEQQFEAFGDCSADSVFAIASITKTFTALALAQMALDGLVRLEAPVRDYLDAEELSTVAPSEREITLLDLATHHSGLPQMPHNRPSKDFRDPFLGFTADDLYATVRKQGLAAPRQAAYKYSNLGYKILGLTMTRAAGRDFAALMHRYVLDPLQLQETTFADPPALVQGRNLWGNRTPVWHFEDAMAASGGLRSTVQDVLRYLQAYLAPPPELADAMEMVQRPVHQLASGAFVGLGWHGSPAGAMWHNGALTGFCSFASFDGPSQTACVVLANQFTPPHSIADDVGMNVGRVMHGDRVLSVRGEPSATLRAKHIALRVAGPVRTAGEWTRRKRGKKPAPPASH
jgi:CubicO group peptidase (beta-lactamase class C family)